MVAIFDELDEDWTAGGRTWLGALGVVLVAGSLIWASGPLGLVAGSLVAVAWYLGPGPYAVAGGHVVSLPVVSATPDPVVLLPLEAGFLAVLVAPMVRDAAAWRPVAVTVLLAASLGAVAWLGWRAWQPRWLVGMALVSLVATALYGVHRYSLVSLELREVEQRS